MKRQISDTVLLSGWLFADLLLGLAVIFLASLGGYQAPVQILTTDVSDLAPAPVGVNNPAPGQCIQLSGGYQCTITLKSRSDSRGNADWQTATDMTNSSVAFNSANPNHVLTPGQSTQVTISGIPCYDGSFTFSGGKTTTPAIVLWKCAQAQERLDFKPKRITFTTDTNGLLGNSQTAIDDVKQKVNGQAFLKNQDVALAVVYTGAPTEADTPRSANVSGKVYAILSSLGGPFHRASYYYDLVDLGEAANVVEIDVFLYTR